MITFGDLQHRLGAVRRAAHAVARVTAAAQVVAGLVGLSAAYFLFDWLFEPPLAGRWIGLLGLLGAAGWTFLRGPWRELRRPWDDDEIALRVEAAHPGLRSALISTVQLSRDQAASRLAGSPELVQALQRETLQTVAPLDFQRVVSRQAVGKCSAAAAVALLVLAVCAIRFPDHLGALLRRLADAERTYPTRTRIREVVTPASVARGAAVPVTVRLDERFEIPEERGTLVFRDPHSGAQTTVELLPAPGAYAAFAGALPEALDDVEVRARLGDARSTWRTVTVLPRPEVRQGAVQYRLPAYTELPDPPAQKLGPLEALQGSTADITFEASQPLTEATLVERSGTRWTCAPVGRDGRRWRLQKPFPLTTPTTVHFALRDTNGLANAEPAVQYPVIPKPDQPPSVKLIRPAHDGTVTPRARVLVRFEAHDDYGLRQVRVACRIQRGEQDEEAAQVQRFDWNLSLREGGRPRRHLPETEATWNLESLKLRPGDRLTFWLEADDYCPTNDAPPAKPAPPPSAPARNAPPDFARSTDIRLTIVSLEEKALEIQNRIARLFEQLRNLKEDQEDLKRKVRDLIDALQKELRETKAGG